MLMGFVVVYHAFVEFCILRSGNWNSSFVFSFFFFNRAMFKMMIRSYVVVLITFGLQSLRKRKWKKAPPITCDFV